jgi:peptide/nickel transport system ATP-binding protein
MPDPVLVVDNLTIALPRGMDRTHAVRDISFALEPGKVLCIVGESGSGKSVTANAVMGLLPSTLDVAGGSIRLRGQELLRLRPEERRSLYGRVVSIIFQDPLSALNPLMTVGAQIAEVMDAHPAAAPANRRERVLELLTEVGLPDPAAMVDQYPFRLSGGQRQRVMIAMALALEPDVLIADEPTTALDVTTQAQILDLIHRIQRRENMAVLFITHDFGVVADIADEVIVMEKGLLVEQGPASKVLLAPSHPYTRRLLAAVPDLRAATSRPAEPEAPVVLEVRGLRKTYRTSGVGFGKAREVLAVDDVSFSVRRGQTVGVVGESGSGKSTLGRLVIKLLDNDGGQILFDGDDVAPMAESEFRRKRPHIQMIFQDPFASLNPRHTIGKVLTVGPMGRGMAAREARARAERLLGRVGLDASAYDRYPHEFSGGQRQRIGIARALMFDPLLLIADEAVSALDVSIQAQILELLDEIQRETRIAMIFITHDLRVASQICDQIAVMHRGKLVEFGPPSQIFHAPRTEYTAGLVAAIPGSKQRTVA